MEAGTSSGLVEIGVSRQLAEFIAASRYDAIPDAVRSHALRAVFNGFGTALGGSGDRAIARLAETFGAIGASGDHIVIGHQPTFDMGTAAFLNAAAMNVFDFDDTHIPTIIHPTAPVVPAVFALAGRRPTSGSEALHAIILGIEVACRLGNAVSPEHYARGWHITATCGIFGAAAACCKLLGLDAEKIVWALGNASAQAGGLVETLGFMAKSVGVGAAARNGLASALMAQNGVEGPPAPLEGQRGFLQVTCSNPEPRLVTEGFGSHWEIMRTMFKPYACGVVLNPVIDACLTARAMPDFEVGAVKAITVRGNPLLKARADRPNVRTGREAQVSAQHAIAISLLRGTAGASEFSDEAVSDPDVRSLRGKIVAIDVDDQFQLESVRLEIELASGQSLAITEDIATGSLDRPMTDSALRAKFESLAIYGCPQVDHRRLAAALWNFEDARDATAVLRFSRRSA